MRSTVRKIAVVGAVAMLAAVTGAARATSPDSLSLSKDSRLWLEGTSTVRSFKCTASKLNVAVTTNPTESQAELVKSAAVSIPVASLDCANDTMNGHMRKALKADANPTISWMLNSYHVAGTTVVMNGLLTIAGKQNEIEITGTGTAEANGTIRIKGSKEFNMTQYGVKPPSLMMGTMKVRDPVKVSFDLVLNP